MPKPPITEESYLRDLPYSAVAHLAETLDINSLWEKLASKIPTKPDHIFTTTDVNFEPRYTMTDIARFGNSRNSSTTALVRDWGSKNVRIKHLVEALYQAELKAAAVYIQQQVLHTEPRRRCTENDNTTNISFGSQPLSTESDRETVTRVMCSQPCPQSAVTCDSQGKKSGAQAAVETPEQLSTEDPRKLYEVTENPGKLYEVTENPGKLYEVTENPGKLYEVTEDTSKLYEVTDQIKCFPFDLLQAITNNFDERNYKDGGNLIGEGGFGTVFIGTFPDGYSLAVKCLKDSADDSLEQFKTELETLTIFKHENLVHLLGYSVADSGPRCLVYQYMSNGSLEERLACRYNTDPLSNSLRLEITRGTAKGIAFLHEGGLVHRDIKSANILLDTNFIPKVGDFATARVLPKGMASHIMKTSVIIGTASYLAPEAISFHIHRSLDAYSFGVVILEILTGLPVTDHARSEVDLKFHVQEHCSEGDDGEEAGAFSDLLDNKGGVWITCVVDTLYSISCRCLEPVRKKRPEMADIVSELESLELIIDRAETE